MQDVLVAHGVAGIGAFWCVIEQLYEQGGTLPLKSCESIAFVLHLDCTVIESLVKDFGLFENDGENFWSDSVIARLCKRADIADKRKTAAIKRWQSIKEMQLQSTGDASALQNDAKESKENNPKENIQEKSGFRFSPPTIEEIKAYILEKGYSFDAESFFDFYQSKGWFVGKNKMKDWKAAIRNWARGERDKGFKGKGVQLANVNDIWDK